MDSNKKNATGRNNVSTQACSPPFLVFSVTSPYALRHSSGLGVVFVFFCESSSLLPKKKKRSHKTDNYLNNAERRCANQRQRDPQTILSACMR